MESGDLINLDSDDSFVIIGYGSPASSVGDFNHLDAVSVTSSKSVESGEMSEGKCSIGDAVAVGEDCSDQATVTDLARNDELTEEIRNTIEQWLKKESTGIDVNKSADSAPPCSSGFSTIGVQIMEKAEEIPTVPAIVVEYASIDGQEPARETLQMLDEDRMRIAECVVPIQPTVNPGEVVDDGKVCELQPAEIKPQLQETGADEQKRTAKAQSEGIKKRKRRKRAKTQKLVETTAKGPPAMVKTKNSYGLRLDGAVRNTTTSTGNVENVCEALAKSNKNVQNLSGTTRVEVQREMTGKSAAKTVQQTKDPSVDGKAKQGKKLATGTVQQTSLDKDKRTPNQKPTAPGKTDVVDVAQENKRLRKAVAEAKQKAMRANQEKAALAVVLGETRKQLQVERDAILRNQRQAMEHFIRKMEEKNEDQRDEVQRPQDVPTVPEKEAIASSSTQMDELMREIRDRNRLCATEHANTARILQQTDLIKGCILVFIVLLVFIFLLMLIEYWAVKRPLRFSLW